MLFEHRNGQRQRQHLGADNGEPDAINHAIDGGEDHQCDTSLIRHRNQRHVQHDRNS